MLETNVHGLIRMTRLVLPHIRDGGHIVNMGSVAGGPAYPNGSLYVASKFAVHGFTQALREDLLGRPIRITNVAPGLVETDFSKVRFRGDEAKASAVYADVALGGPVQPEDVAECVALRTHPAGERERRRDRGHGARRSRAARASSARNDGAPLAMTILEGSTFCICDEIGDLDGRTSGFFAEDTRFLSRLELRVNGARPLLLSSGTVEYFSAAFFLRNPVAEGLAQDSLSIARERFVGDGMQDHLVVRNETASRSRFELALECGHATLRTSSPSRSTTSRSATRCTRGRCPRPPRPATTAPTSSCSRSGTAARRHRCSLSRAGLIEGRASASRSSSRPRERWELRVDVVPSLTGASAPLVGRAALRRGRGARAGIARRPGGCGCHSCAPHDELARCVHQSVADLAALRMRGATAASGCFRRRGCPGS